MDWFAGFGPDEATPDFMSLGFREPCNNPDNPSCLAEYRQSSDFGEVHFIAGTENRNGLGVMLGELWVTYADVGADVGGKFRMTPKARGTMSASSYLHVTMQVDAYTTGRRYPQIIVSDAQVPVQTNIKNSNTVIVQTFPDDGTANWPYAYQVEICDNRNWEVNDQCPSSDLYRINGRGVGGGADGLAANAEVGENAGEDRSTHFDVFLSTRRAYLFLNNQPYGCVDLPASGTPSGQVTVTFGDVLYHSGVDIGFTYHDTYQQIYAKRHFDNLGFKSGVEGPAWDEARLPCYAASTITN
jgi:hypothetical protein